MKLIVSTDCTLNIKTLNKYSFLIDNLEAGNIDLDIKSKSLPGVPHPTHFGVRIEEVLDRVGQIQELLEDHRVIAAGDLLLEVNYY